MLGDYAIVCDLLLAGRTETRPHAHMHMRLGELPLALYTRLACSTLPSASHLLGETRDPVIVLCAKRSLVFPFRDVKNQILLMPEMI